MIPNKNCKLKINRTDIIIILDKLMTKLNLLIVEGNIQKDTELFTKAAGSSVSENLKKLLLVLEPTALIKIVHPGNKNEADEALKNCPIVCDSQILLLINNKFNAHSRPVEQ